MKRCTLKQIIFRFYPKAFVPDIQNDSIIHPSAFDRNDIIVKSVEFLCEGFMYASKFTQSDISPRHTTPCRHINPTISNGQSTPHIPFQSARPVRGETRECSRIRPRCHYFNPLAPCGARLKSCCAIGNTGDFNPLAPCGARLRYAKTGITHHQFQSARPVRGETSHNDR